MPNDVVWELVMRRVGEWNPDTEDIEKFGCRRRLRLHELIARTAIHVCSMASEMWSDSSFVSHADKWPKNFEICDLETNKMAEIVKTPSITRVAQHLDPLHMICFEFLRHP